MPQLLTDLLNAVEGEYSFWDNSTKNW